MVSGVIGFHGSLAVWHVEKGRELGRDYVTIRLLYMVVFPVQVSLWPAISVTRANAQVRESEINCTPRIFFNDQEIEKKNVSLVDLSAIWSKNKFMIFFDKKNVWNNPSNYSLRFSSLEQKAWIRFSDQNLSSSKIHLNDLNYLNILNSW